MFQRRLLAAIEWYQRSFAWRPSPCRFYPTCSAYGHEAIATHGARHGLWLTVKRLARCRPFGPSGFDPVPEHRHATPPARTGSDVTGSDVTGSDVKGTPA